VQWFLTGAIPLPWGHFGLSGGHSFEGGGELFSNSEIKNNTIYKYYITTRTLQIMKTE